MSEVHIDIAYDAFMAAEQDGSQRDAIRAALATQDALIRELKHQVERLQHFEQVHIDNLDMYRAQIAAIEAEHRVEIADMAERFRAVNVAEAVQQITGHEALIRELVAALDRIAKGEPYHWCNSRAEVALAKAKAAGFEP